MMKKEMKIGYQIAYHRKRKGITQKELAERMNVSCQAVSKWEHRICCPDIMILPELANIFDVTIDELFGNAINEEGNGTAVGNVPWEDDGKLRIAVYIGQDLIKQNQYICSEGENLIDFEFQSHDASYALNGVCNLCCKAREEKQKSNKSKN